jgi:hypothetical protein
MRVRWEARGTRSGEFLSVIAGGSRESPMDGHDPRFLWLRCCGHGGAATGICESYLGVASLAEARKGHGPRLLCAREVLACRRTGDTQGYPVASTGYPPPTRHLRACPRTSPEWRHPARSTGG